MIFLNFKIYQETSAGKAVKLCRLIKEISRQFSIKIIPCLQAVDIYKINQNLKFPIWAQHADPVGFGKFTGYQAPISLKTAGASGVLINHSEHQLSLDQIQAAVAACRESKMRVMIITDTLELIKQVNQLKPDYIGFEDPKLIGGPVAMIDAHFDLVKQAAAVAQAPLIVGGGIRTRAQVRKVLKAGGRGILVASEFAKSLNPEATLLDLVSGFK